MLTYCIDRLNNYDFQNAPEYKLKFDSYEAEYYFLRKYVCDLLTGDYVRNIPLKRIDYLKQLSILMDKLNRYESKENRQNLKYISLMISLLHYGAQLDDLRNIMNLIDYCD